MQYITKNRLIVESNKKRLQVLIIVQMFLLGLFFVLKELFPERKLMIYLIIAILTYIFFKRIPNVGAVLRAGGKGEQNALKILKNLPKNYTIFNQVKILFHPNSDKTQEFDYIIVGPTSVFIVEVKNNSGNIFPSRKSKRWLVRKRQYTKDMLNPINQVNRQITLLGKFLSSNDLYPKIIETLLFVHRESEVKIPKDMNELVFTDKKLVKWIKKQEHNQPLIDTDIIISLMQILKKTFK